jgi:hypothetical protein
MKKNTKINWNLIIRWAGTLLSIGILIYLFRQIGAAEPGRGAKISAWRAAAVLGLVFISRLATWGAGIPCCRCRMCTCVGRIVCG